jgi:hypothetical protein
MSRYPFLGVAVGVTVIAMIVTQNNDFTVCGFGGVTTFVILGKMPILS